MPRENETDGYCDKIVSIEFTLLLDQVPRKSCDEHCTPNKAKIEEIFSLNASAMAEVAFVLW